MTKIYVHSLAQCLTQSLPLASSSSFLLMEFKCKMPAHRDPNKSQGQEAAVGFL